MAMRWKWIGMLMLLAGLWLQPVSAEREVYRCVYPGGLVEFRGVPMPGIDCVFFGSRLPSDPRADSVGDPETTPATAAPDSPDSAASGDLRVQNCEIARRNLTVLEDEAPVVSTGPDGQSLLMSDDEREGMLRQTRRDVGYWCEDS